MAGREVITLQFGGFSNYVGAHYWNFQVWRALQRGLAPWATPITCPCGRGAPPSRPG